MATNNASSSHAQCIVIDDEKKTATVKCEVCREHFMGDDPKWLYEIMKPSDADFGQADFTEIARRIDEQRELLIKFVGDRGDLFYKKWTESTLAQKKEWLGTAVRDMPADWKFVADLKDEYKKSTKNGVITLAPKADVRMSLLLPYMNHATLTRHEMVLPNLVVARCLGNHCNDWLRFDAQQMCGSWNTDFRMLGPYGIGLPSKVIATGIATDEMGNQFGRAQQFDAAKVHSWEHIGAGRAYTALEAQEEILSALFMIVWVVTDFNYEPATRGGQLLAQTVGLIHQQEPSLSVLYSSPQQFHLTRVAARMREQLQASLEDLNALQIDSECLKAFVDDIASGDKWAFAATVMLPSSCVNIQKLERLLELCGHYEVETTMNGRTRVAQSIAIAAAEAIVWQEYLVYCMVKISRAFEPMLEETGRAKGWLMSRQLFDSDPLMWVLDTLVQEPILSLRSGTLQQRFDLLHQITDSASTRDKRLSDSLLEQLNLLELYDQLLRAVTLLKDQHIRLDKEFPKSTDDALRMPVYPPGGHHSKESKKAGQALREFANAKRPEGKKATVDLDRFEKVESRRKDVWKHVRTSWASRPGFEQQASLLLSDFESDQAEEVVRGQRTKFQRVLDLEKEEQKRKEEQKLADYVEQTRRWTEGASQHSPSPTVSKKRQKRAARDKSPPPEPAPVAQPQAPPPPLETIYVSKRALESFQGIFPEPGTPVVKEMRWIEFQQAMAEAGFAMHEGSGSAQHFARTNDAGETVKITFHRLHTGIIAQSTLCRIARRLNMRFDWDSDTFKAK